MKYHFIIFNIGIIIKGYRLFNDISIIIRIFTSILDFIKSKLGGEVIGVKDGVAFMTLFLKVRKLKGQVLSHIYRHSMGINALVIGFLAYNTYEYEVSLLIEAICLPLDTPSLSSSGDLPAATSIFFFHTETSLRKRSFVLLGMLLLLTAITVIVTKSALCLLILIGALSTTPYLLLIPKRYSGLTTDILEVLVKAFYHFGVLKPLFYLYTFLNTSISFRKYKIITLFFGIILLSFILLNRYLFFLKLEHQHISLGYLLLYLILLVGVCIRVLFNYSFFIIPLTFTRFPHIGLLLTGDMPDIPEIPVSKPSSTTPITYKGWFTKHVHHHNYYYPPEIPRSYFTRNVGLGIGGIGLCLTGFACYQYYRSANAAILAADAAVKANNLNALSQGIITREEYFKRHPEDKHI